MMRQAKTKGGQDAHAYMYTHRFWDGIMCMEYTCMIKNDDSSGIYIYILEQHQELVLQCCGMCSNKAYQ